MSKPEKASCLGIGIGNKIVSGKIKIVNTEYDAKVRINKDMPKINKDDILLFDRINNLDYLLLFQSAGIISKSGGRTSHAAIILRELGKPGIIGIGRCADRLKNGDFVILNPMENRFVIKPKNKE